MSDFTEKAGAFASRAAGKARSFAKFTADKTRKLSRIAKLNMDISSQRDAKRRVFTDIGRLYYESQKNPPEEEIAPLFQKVDEALQNIASMEAEIARLKAADPAVESDAEFESVVEADEQSAAEIVIEVTAEDTAPDDDSEPAETPTDEPAEAPAEEPAEAPAQEPAEEPAETPPEETPETPDGETREEA